METPAPADSDGFMPLEGTRVLDFSKILAGPLCTQYLGDMGADVVKVEPCTGGDDTRAWPPFEDGDGTIFLAVNRNKRSPFSPVDQGTGLHAVIGILGGLLQRQRTGQGMKIEASLFDSAVSFLGYFLQGFWQRGTEPKRVGAGHESLCPYQVFETADRPLILGIANDTLWRAYCNVVGEPALADDRRFAQGAERVRHREETVAEVSRIMATRTREEWMSILEGPGIPCSPVHNLGELVNHPHTIASDILLTYHNDSGRELNGVASPLRVNGERVPLRSTPPRLGQHSREVLADAGYTSEDIHALIREGAVFSAVGAEVAAASQ